MAKVFGIHYITIKTGATLAEFEAYIARATPHFEPWPGVDSYVTKGERGDRKDRLLYVVDFESIETRNRYFPAAQTYSVEALERFAAYENFMPEWEQYATFGGDPVLWTDYVVIAEM